MENIEKKPGPMPRKLFIPILVFCALVTVASVIRMFAEQKGKLDQEFEGMITSSLNIHTQSNVDGIDRTIESAGEALRIAQSMLELMGQGRAQDIIDRMNAQKLGFALGYSPAKAPDFLPSTEPGEVVAGEIGYFDAFGGYFLPVVLRQGEGTLYACIPAEGLLPGVAESAVYQDVYSCLIAEDGRILFNTFRPEERINLFDSLVSFGLSEQEIDDIAAVIRSPEMDSATFLRHGETYYVSAGRMAHNDWHLISVVRGPDVLLRSTNIFNDMVRTGIASFLLAGVAACVVFLLFLSGRDRLKQEQDRNGALTHRLRAMFEQHSALKVVFEAETGIIVDVNPSALKHFGYTREETLGRNVREFNLLPEDRIDEKLKGGLVRGDMVLSSVPHLLKSGEIRLFDAYCSMILDGENKLFYAILTDVTDRERYRSELLQEKELLRTTLQSIGDGVVTTDNHGKITGMNSVAEDLTGWSEKMALGRTFTDVFVLKNEDTGQTVENPVQKVLRTGLVIGLANHTELISRQGICIPVADSAAPIKAKDGQTLGVVMVFRDVSDEKERTRQVEYLSYHDPLTGLFNRHYMEEAMTWMDLSEEPVSIIMADVNGLKITNDVFGHKAGDKLLKNVANLMNRYCKPGDVTARWGGDEFVILMPGTTLDEAEAVARRIKETRVVLESGNLTLSLSLGCAWRDSAETSIHAAMQRAEEYMYHQKLLDGKSYRNAIISTLLATLYEKSNETEEHSKRIERHCHDIGRKLQLSSQEMDELSLLALLHDIGKVTIDPNILQKAGPLMPEEWDEMRRHPEIGYRIAQTTPELSVVADLILSHHERWDGKGYPRGLKGAEIPLPCRILAVADAYDAMRNDRVYRQALRKEEAVRELEENSGTQFEPRIVRLFLEALEAEG